MKKIAKNIVSNEFWLSYAGSQRFIFVYHDISDETNPYFSAEYYSTKIDNFHRQIQFLTKKFEIIPLDELVTNRELKAKKNFASVVFDDGFSSVIKNALPVLKQHKIPFSIFVNKYAALFNQIWVSNLVIYRDDENYLRKIYEYELFKKMSFEEFRASPVENLLYFQLFDTNFRQHYLREEEIKAEKVYLTPEEIVQLSNDDVLVGSHSTDHYVLGRCTHQEFSAQVNDNRTFLDELLGQKTKHFAIPFGKKNSYETETVKALFDSGHNYVYTTNPMSFKPKKMRGENHLIPRIGILDQEPKDLMFYVNRTFLKNYDL